MRDSLTVLAILVIGVLTAALVAPHVIDWGSHRSLIARKLSEAAGVRVAVEGPIEVQLLPRPIFHLGRISVGDAEAGRPRLTAETLDAEMSIAALMRGQVQVVDATLDRARLDLTQAADGSFGLALPGGEGADRVRLDHLGIRGGAVALALSDGRHATLSDLDLDGEASSLRGPFKLSGRVGAGESALPFRIATGALDRGRLRVKLRTDAAPPRPALDLDGTVAQVPGAAGPAFDGTAALAGDLALADTPATVPWRLTAHLTANRDAATADDVELRAGADARALIAGGSGTAGFAARVAPAATLRLHAAGLDVDRLAVAPNTSAVAPPQGVELLRLLFGAADGGARIVSLPARVAVSLDLDTATVDGQTLLGTHAALGLGPDPTAAMALSVEGPDGARLALDGRFAPAGADAVAGPARFTGRLDARTPDLRRTAAWLAPSVPGASSFAAVRAVTASGDLEATPDGAVLRGLDLGLDGSRLRGTLGLTRGGASKPPRLDADLQSDALDLGRLPDLSGAMDALRDLDLDLSLAARAVTLPLPLPPPSGGAGTGSPITVGHAALRLTRAGDDLQVRRLALDLGGGAVEATGSRTGGEARAEVHVTAPELGPLADVAAKLLPGPAAAALRGAAARLSPVDATLRIEAAAGAPGGALAPTRAALDGSLGGLRVAATLVPERPDDGLAADLRPLVLALRADAPDGADLLRMAGLLLAPPAAGGLGPAHLDATARGSLGAGADAVVHVVLGATAASFEGRAGTTLGAGRLKLGSADLGPLLAALGTIPRPGGSVPATVEGDLGWVGGRLSLDHLSADALGTKASGDLALNLALMRPGHGEAALSGTLQLDRLSAAALLAPALGAPGPAADAPPSAAWSTARFGPPAVALPRAEVGLRIAVLPLRDGVAAHDVSLSLRSGDGLLALADGRGRLDAGEFTGALTLRREGATATVSGRATWDGVAFDGGGLSASVGGTQEFGGSGDSPAALVASLAGGGSLTLTGAALARTDPAAPVRTADALAPRAGPDEEMAPPDADLVRHRLEAEFDRAALPLGDGSGPTVLAAGVFHSPALRAGGTFPPPRDGVPAAWSADTAAALDLASLVATSRSRLAIHAPGTGPGDDGGSVAVKWSGPLGGPARREFDAAGLVNAVQARAIARAQDRIDVLEQDIRERAAFNRQLKAIQAIQQAERAQADERRRALERAAEPPAAGLDPARPRGPAPRIPRGGDVPFPSPAPSILRSGDGPIMVDPSTGGRD